MKFIIDIPDRNRRLLKKMKWRVCILRYLPGALSHQMCLQSSILVLFLLHGVLLLRTLQKQSNFLHPSARQKSVVISMVRLQKVKGIYSTQYHSKDARWIFFTILSLPIVKTSSSFFAFSAMLTR